MSKQDNNRLRTDEQMLSLVNAVGLTQVIESLICVVGSKHVIAQHRELIAESSTLDEISLYLRQAYKVSKGEDPSNERLFGVPEVNLGTLTD